MQKIILILQARLGSLRLPQKVLKPLLGKPLIARILERLKGVQTPHHLVIATTSLSEDTRLARYLEALGYSVYRGDSKQVLKRFYECSQYHKGEIIVRLTADCPLLQPSLIDEMLTEFQKLNCDYYSNVHPRTYPKGFDVEVFTFQSLEKAFLEAKTPYAQEHVTPYFYEHPETFRIANKSLSKDYSKINVSVDTLEDFYWVEKLFQRYYQANPLFGLEELLEFTQNEPHFIDRLVPHPSSL